MLQKLIELAKKRRDILLYLVFGVLTTLVNWGSFYLLRLALPGASVVAPNTIAWVVSVLFAYLTNRTWVFHSQARGAAALLREIASFVGARIFSGLVDTAIMAVAVDLLGYHDGITKICSNVLVVILNYLFSRFWVFRRQRGSKERPAA